MPAATTTAPAYDSISPRDIGIAMGGLRSRKSLLVSTGTVRTVSTTGLVLTVRGAASPGTVTRKSTGGNFASPESYFATTNAAELDVSDVAITGRRSRTRNPPAESPSTGRNTVPFG